MGIAAESLGNCYEFGYGVEKLEPCALYYYRLAAHYNDCYGLKRLGTAYLKGELGLPAQPNTADYFFELAKELEK
ncbi:MAG: hypothetical protein ACSNEK_00200 [Parachlamydiaceae bacterium]